MKNQTTKTQKEKEGKENRYGNGSDIFRGADMLTGMFFEAQKNALLSTSGKCTNLFAATQKNVQLYQDYVSDMGKLCSTMYEHNSKKMEDAYEKNAEIIENSMQKPFTANAPEVFAKEAVNQAKNNVSEFAGNCGKFWEIQNEFNRKFFTNFTA